MNLFVRAPLLLIAAALIIFVTELIKHFLYISLVVPKLPRLHAVPLAWWVGLEIPVGGALFLMGFMSRSVMSVLACSVGATAGFLIFESIAAHTNWASYLKSYAIEAPTFFYTVGAGINFTIALSGVLTGFGARYLFRRWRSTGHGEPQLTGSA